MSPVIRTLGLLLSVTLAVGATEPYPRQDTGGEVAVAQPPPGRLETALAHRAAGDPQEAIRVFEQATSPLSLDEVKLLGSLYLAVNRPADALARLEPLTSGSEPDPGLLFFAGWAARDLGRTDLAERLLGTAVRQAPVSRAALMLWELLARQERFAEAADVLAPLAMGGAAAEVERADPELAADVALGYARTVIAAGHPLLAIEPLQRRTRLRSDEEEGWRLLGESLLEAERFAEARTALAEAQRLSEELRQRELEARVDSPVAGLGFEALMQKSNARRTEGDLEGALAAVTQAVRLSPRDPRARMAQVQLLLSLERNDDALRRADGLVELAGGHPWALYLRGMSRLATGDPKGAESDFRSALERNQEQIPVLNALASLLMQRGELIEAEGLCLRALELAPDNPTANANLERIRARRAN